MKKIEIIDKSEYVQCWACNGTGKKTNGKCKACDGTGLWKEPSYIMVAEQPNGQRIAFQSDFIK